MNLNQYVALVESGNSFNIPGNVHNCGYFPVVQVYGDGEQIVASITVNHKSGDIKVSWNVIVIGSIKIVVIGG